MSRNRRIDNLYRNQQRTQEQDHDKCTGMMPAEQEALTEWGVVAAGMTLASNITHELIKFQRHP